MKRDIEELHRITYMLERSAALILTDFRVSQLHEGRLKGYCSPQKLDEGKSQIILSILLLVCLNAIKMWQGFKDAVLIRMQEIHKEVNHSTSKKMSKIDWNQTFINYSNNNEDAIFKSDQTPKTHDVELLSNIFYEYKIQVEILISYLEGTDLPNQFLHIKDELEGIQETIRIADDLKFKIKPNNEIVFKKASNLFIELLSSTYKNFPQKLKKYKSYLSKLFKSKYFKSRITKNAIDWRSEFLSFNTGLGSGGNILLKPTTDIPHLYELWCFYEFINRLIKNKYKEISQYCYLASTKNLELFSIGNNGKIYYNYQGEKNKFVQDTKNNFSKILKRTNVEWYIEYNKNKIVFDTKYKKWSSNDNLTVLGYMNDFNANVGIVIFAKNFDKEAYKDPIFSNSRIAINKFEEKIFIAMNLIPSSEAEKLNEETLDIAISQIFSN